MHGGLTSRRYFFIELCYRFYRFFTNRTVYQNNIFRCFYGKKDNFYRHSSLLPKYNDIKWSYQMKTIEMYKALRCVIKSILKFFTNFLAVNDSQTRVSVIHFIHGFDLKTRLSSRKSSINRWNSYPERSNVLKSAGNHSPNVFSRTGQKIFLFRQSIYEQKSVFDFIQMVIILIIGCFICALLLLLTIKVLYGTICDVKPSQCKGENSNAVLSFWMKIKLHRHGKRRWTK